MKLNGNATLADLTEEYNKMHFPRNKNYKELAVKDVRKTMQGDIAKLIRDRTVERIIIRPSTKHTNICHGSSNRLITIYKLTEYGWKIIEGYRLSPYPKPTIQK
jgi:hypothetical protein